MKKWINVSLLTLILFTSLFLIPTFTVPETGDPESIKVMTYNIHQYYVEDNSGIGEKSGAYVFEELLAVIEDANPDVIGLQESEGARLSSGNVNGISWLAQQLDMYYYYGPPTSDQIYGVSLLSKWPITSKEYQIHPRPEGIERSVIRVSIDSPFGILNVFNTHFEINEYNEAQRLQAEYIVDYVGDNKAIILGDFNSAAKRNDEAFHVLNNTFTYAWIEDGNHPNATEGYTSPASEPKYKIDYIWLTQGDWEVVPNTVKILGSVKASDHLAVFAEIKPL